MSEVAHTVHCDCLVCQSRRYPKPTLLPLMRHPVRSVEKESAEKEMRDLLERTRLMLRNK